MKHHHFIQTITLQRLNYYRYIIQCLVIFIELGGAGYYNINVLL